ncbi:cytidylate kinase family protein [Actinokineospora enzanensis]|uniref:cytidylate kinase family protein n=1 Tax=Actinokineospora enzanensis TaxID=155975 RepID=UPI000375E773|nr:cytidylate kinase family protein [Actinokineospora enzanensis]
MNVTISGLTAAGKTTHALLLARELDYDYVSASSLLLSALGVSAGGRNTLWATGLSTVERMRDARPVDRDLNDRLRNELRTRDRTVFDSWAAPWLSEGGCVRVFIESDRPSRARKARVSQEPCGPFLTQRECGALLDTKDTTTAERLLPLLGLDIRRDRTVFDVVMDNSALIEAPTVTAARRGIAQFHPELVTAVRAILDTPG